LLFLTPLAWGQTADVGVYLGFEQKPPPARLLHALQTETASLLQPAGISLGWRLLAKSNGGEAFPKVFVVRFKGTCEEGPRLGGEARGFDPLERPVRLGGTRVSEGRMSAHAEIECDSVRWGVLRPSEKQPQGVFASALAKVVAHELYHFLSNSAAHAKRGLAKPVLGWHELAQRRTGFGKDELKKMKDSSSVEPQEKD
jgi:hypothetical protein